MAVAGDPLGPGLVPSTTQYGVALADIVRCAACGHMQVDPMPAQARLERAYADAASTDYVEEEAGQRETARRALERIEAHVRGHGELLDVGCWVGFLLAEARDRGWRVMGVEPSEFASAYAREQLGLNVHTAELFSTPFSASSFDAVTLGDVIEHLPEPSTALGRIAELLKPDGVVWLALPDAGSRVARALGPHWWSVLPTHVQYFTRDSIRRLLERCNFEPLEIATAPKAFTAGYYLGRIEGYSPRLAKSLTAAARSAGIDRRLLAPDFRDRMAVIARVRPPPAAASGTAGTR
jgi:SAM-dependent methyltransferase